MRVEEIDALLGGEAQRLADKYTSVPLDFMDGYGWAVTQICRLFPDVEPQKWIPCSKEIPDEYEPVLTYTNRGEIKIMERVMEWGGFMWQDEADYLHDIDFVQAWMPLPERYEVEG